MKTNIQAIQGPWDLGYSLDKHTLNSVYTGDNEYGHPTFDTTRSDSGEALYQLKYKNQHQYAAILGEQLFVSLSRAFSTASLIAPMPPSRQRVSQPVTEIAKRLASCMDIPCMENLLYKKHVTAPIKDLGDRAQKVQTLKEAFAINDVLGNDGVYDVLIIDDLFDSGSSLEAATYTLRGYAKVRNVFAATITRKHDA